MWKSFLFAIGSSSVLGACAPKPNRPLLAYTPLKCVSMGAAVGSEEHLQAQVDAPEVIDQTLGWEKRVWGAPDACKHPAAEDAEYCRMSRRILERHTAFQERPLDELGVRAGFRGSYMHTEGVWLSVRVLPIDGGAVLVAKALEPHGGPLAWITSRRLSEGQWLDLLAASSRLPDGRHDYAFTREHWDAIRPGGSSSPRCYRAHGASVSVERIENNALHVIGGAYVRPAHVCQGACCDPEAEAASRFFDRLVDLVGCAREP
jgi:hypothetical protein